MQLPGTPQHGPSVQAPGPPCLAPLTHHIGCPSPIISDAPCPSYRPLPLPVSSPQPVTRSQYAYHSPVVSLCLVPCGSVSSAWSQGSHLRSPSPPLQTGRMGTERGWTEKGWRNRCPNPVLREERRLVGPSVGPEERGSSCQGPLRTRQKKRSRHRQTPLGRQHM